MFHTCFTPEYRRPSLTIRLPGLQPGPWRASRLLKKCSIHATIGLLQNVSHLFYAFVNENVEIFIRILQNEFFNLY